MAGPHGTQWDRWSSSGLLFPFHLGNFRDEYDGVLFRKLLQSGLLALVYGVGFPGFDRWRPLREPPAGLLSSKRRGPSRVSFARLNHSGS